MFINEVYQQVGLSKKSIRYYEEIGLLRPKRNQENDYRIYDEEDIKRLKLIKFLRELGVPIQDLKRLVNKELSLEACMKDRITKIDALEENLKKVKELCLDIASSGVDMEEIDSTSYFQSMSILNKEGFTLRNVKTNKTKKILGAVLSSLLFGGVFLFLMGLFTYFWFMGDIPLVYFILLLFMVGSPFIAIVVNLVKRIQEINGGEEDEASKY